MQKLAGGALGGGGVGFAAVDALRVARDAGIEAFGDALVVFGLPELRSVLLVGDEADLGEDAGHVGADQDDEGGLLDAAVVEAGVAFFEAGEERSVNLGGDLFGLVDLVLERDLFDEVLEVMHALVGDGILASGDSHGIGVGGEVEVIDFNAADGRLRRAIGV